MNKIVTAMMNLIRFEITKAKAPNFTLDLLDDELKRLYRLSKAHDVAHLVGFALEENDFFTDKGRAATEFRRLSTIAVSRYEQMHYEFVNVCDEFEKSKIPFIPLKGSVMWNFYPQPWMRTCCDIDILIHESDLERASGVLTGKLSYTLAGRGTHDVGFISPTGRRLELHFNLIEDYFIGNAAQPLQDVWENAVCAPDSVRYEMTDEMFYYYHVAHMAKHYIRGGCGVRPFIDLWVLNHRVSYNAEKRRRLLAEHGLLAFERAAYKLAEKWFSDGDGDELTESMQKYVLFGGTYGRPENRAAAARPTKGGKCCYTFSRLFLPYAIMKEKYPVLKKHKLLLPIMHVRRWFELLRRDRFGYCVREIKTYRSLSDEKKSEVAKMMEQLDLHN